MRFIIVGFVNGTGNFLEHHVVRGLPTVLVLVAITAALGWWAWSAKLPVDVAQNSQQLVATHVDLNRLRLMTANIRFSDPQDGENIWPKRRELLVKTMLKYDPDLIACQEVTPTQGAYLIKELAAWYTHYPRAGVGNVEGDQGRLVGAVNETFTSLNTLFYKTDRFDQIDGSAGLVLPGQLQEVPAENTFYTLAVLRERQTAANQPAKTWITVDTHLRHQEKFAEQCAEALRIKINDTLKKYPHSGVIVMGDMNHDRTSGMYHIMTEGLPADGLGPLVDTYDYSKKSPQEAWGNYHAFTGKPQSEWPTDFIFSATGWKSDGAQIVHDQGLDGRWPSDHFLVLTELRNQQD